MLKTMDDVVMAANLAGLRGSIVVGIIPPSSAASGGYMIVTKPYEVKSATERDLRFS